MTPDEHQRERMRHWSRAFVSVLSCNTIHASARTGDDALAELDKRFPAPSAAAPVEPVAIRDTRLRVDIPAAEFASLRQKARLWDAVASGKVRIDYNLQDTYGAFYGPIGKGKRTDNMDTAEEAVEAAIAAGALK